MSLLTVLTQTAFDWTWKTSLYATALIVLIIALQRMLARWLTPRLRYSLSLLILIRLLLPTAPSSAWSFENLFPRNARTANQMAVQPILNPPTVDAAPIPQSPPSLLPKHAAAALVNVSKPGILCVTWASGCLCLMLLAGWRLRKWNDLVSSGRRISDPPLLELLNASREAMKVRQTVELVVIRELSSPAVFGLFRLRLLLPEAALRQLSAGELRMVFLHEMAHVRRGDVLWNYLLIAVQFLHWFNPLVWLALHRLRADRELVCDSMAMEKMRPDERLGYGRVLLKLMDEFAAGPPVFSTAIPVVNSAAEIKRRILMIKTPRPASRAVLAASVLLVGTLVLGFFTRAHGQMQPTATRNPAEFTRHAANNPLDAETKAAIQSLEAGLRSENTQARRDALIKFWTSPLVVTEAENPALAGALPILLQAATNLDAWDRDYVVTALHKIKSSDLQVVKMLGYLVRTETDLNTATVAATTLKEIGPSAAPAVPDLIQDLEDRNDDGTFISETGKVAPNISIGTALRRAELEALGNIGAPAHDAIPLLRKLLTDTGEFALGNHVFSAKALWQITGKTDEALPVLINALEKENCFWAADILAMMGADAKPAIPALRHALESPQRYTRLRSAIALHTLTPEFQVPLPLLQNLLKDENDTTRFEAAQCLWQITHDAPLIVPTLLYILTPNTNGLNGLLRRDDYSCLRTIQLLGEIGPAAQAAIPRLKEIAAQDKGSRQMNQSAEKALKNIEGNVPQ